MKRTTFTNSFTSSNGKYLAQNPSSPRTRKAWSGLVIERVRSKPLHTTSRGLKGRPKPRAACVPPLQGRDLFGDDYLGFHPRLSYRGLAALRAAPDRGRAGYVAGGGGRAEAPASGDRRQAGPARTIRCLAPRHP